MCVSTNAKSLLRTCAVKPALGLSPRRACSLRVHTSQPTDYPRAAYTLRGLHQPSQEIPACCRCATVSTPSDSRTTHGKPTRCCCIKLRGACRAYSELSTKEEELSTRSRLSGRVTSRKPNTSSPRRLGVGRVQHSQQGELELYSDESIYFSPIAEPLVLGYLILGQTYRSNFINHLRLIKLNEYI